MIELQFMVSAQSCIPYLQTFSDAVQLFAKPAARERKLGACPEIIYSLEILCLAMCSAGHVQWHKQTKIFSCHAIAPITAAIEEVGLQAISSWVLSVWLKTQTAETDESTLIISVSMWLRPLL